MKLQAQTPSTGGDAAAKIVCNGRVGNPHWSKTGKAILFKDKVICTGSGVPSVSVGFTGVLGFDSGGSPGNPVFGPLRPKFTCALQVQVVTINNPKPTLFYCPPTTAKVKGSGTYNAYGRIAVGPKSDVGASPNVYVKTCS